MNIIGLLLLYIEIQEKSMFIKKYKNLLYFKHIPIYILNNKVSLITIL